MLLEKDDAFGGIVASILCAWLFLKETHSDYASSTPSARGRTASNLIDEGRILVLALSSDFRYNKPFLRCARVREG